ncbi:MAG TPA: hypothetical protein VJN67_09880 [Stellaceae bacterium]|nr:hypothetical protein [Stellaceae bacterium]
MFLATAVTAMALIGGVNYAIDPFDLFSAPRLERINTVKSVGNIRFAKPLQLEMRRPETVILGSSRSLYGLDPQDFPDPARTYDFGIPALSATEMRGYGEHILAEAPVRKIVIELGFFQFNRPQSATPNYDHAMLGRAALLRALPIVLFSQEALNRSARTIADSRRGAGPFDRSDGFAYFHLDLAKDPTAAFLKVVDQFAHVGGPYGAPQSFEAPMAQYRALLAELNARGIDVVTFIAPEHASLLVVVDRNGLWPLYRAWERRLAEVSAEAGVPLWDFSGYNAYTTTPLADGYRTHFDANHFRPEIGRLIIARITGGAEPADFGVRLTPDVVERHLADLEAARLAYRRSRAEDVARIEAVADGPSHTAMQ